MPLEVTDPCSMRTHVYVPMKKKNHAVSQFFTKTHIDLGQYPDLSLQFTKATAAMREGERDRQGYTYTKRSNTNGGDQEALDAYTCGATEV
jgi:hypothetical protein